MLRLISAPRIRWELGVPWALVSHATCLEIKEVTIICLNGHEAKYS